MDELQIVIAAIGAGTVFPALLRSVSAWLATRHNRVKVKIVVDGQTIELDTTNVQHAERVADEIITRQGTRPEGSQQ